MTKGTILLVEDNDDDVQLTLRALKRNKMLNEVVVANDGLAALDLLFGTDAKEPLKPVLILLDLKMPRLGGLDVLKRLYENEGTRHIPTVVLTTSKEEDDVIKSYKYGANSYIRKPVDFTQFAKAVGQVGMYWLMLNEPIPNPNDI